MHVVVACTDRKRSGADKAVRLRSVPPGSTGARFDHWWSALASAPSRIPARDLYVGDHWAVARTLPESASRAGYRPTLWVASAGYGLVPETALLAPYSATFNQDSPDAVAAPSDDPRSARQEWWSHLSQRNLNGEDPRSLTELAERVGSGAVIMLVASPAYVAALEADLVSALCTQRRRFIVVTSKLGRQSAALHDVWVPATAGLRMSLGGALTSLHARVARRLIENVEPAKLDAHGAREHVARLAARAPALPRFQRDKSDDDDVQTFIRAALLSEPGASHTRLLREYRAAGRACEQSRFRDLFYVTRGNR